MLSLIAAPNHLPLSPLSVRNLNLHAVPSLVLTIDRSSRTRSKFRRQQAVLCFNLVPAKESGSLGVVDSKRRQYESTWCCSCKGWESEGDSALEAEILEFMTKSEKPSAFPTKKELVDAGRVDLVEAISNKGGWLSLGWDLDEHGEQENVEENYIQRAIDCNSGAIFGGGIGDVQRRDESSCEINFLEGAEVGSFGFSAVSSNSSQSASSSGRSLTIGDGEDTGIGGILSRLEKQRNLSFGINLGGNGYPAHDSNNGGDESSYKTAIDVDSADLERSRKGTSGSLNEDTRGHFDGKIGHKIALSDSDILRTALEPETWRTWGIQWAGSSDTKEFEAAEISFNENEMSGTKDSSRDGIHEIRESATDALDIRKAVNHSQIKTRIEHLELELSSALRLLRSKSEESISKEGRDGISDDLRKLSDAWEFQENEVMNAQNRLRSLRAKLAVLEGKMALAIIDAQKMAEEKQKKIDGARRALQLLRTACIVWPNSASEVLLVGSFDGWTTQRKMEKSSTGIFSVYLKLYPGRYEIKFIVDGIWRIDPLRPIVRNNGHENNLLIIT